MDRLFIQMETLSDKGIHINHLKAKKNCYYITT